MASSQAGKKDVQKDQSGIAIFMVIAAVAVLSLLVTEFAYIAQVNQKLAFDGLDQIKAHYVAKSGFKLSLLRLKAFQTVKNVLGNMGGGGNNSNGNKSGGSSGGAGSMVPQSLLNQIWAFPFFYPIPTNVPGMSISDKDMIEKFQNASGLEGQFSSVIEAGSTNFDLNSILPSYAAPAPSPSPSPTPNPPPFGQPQTQPTPSPSPSFNPEDARKSLQDYLTTLITNKSTDDQDFAEDYRDLKMDDLMDALVGWADPTYERKTSTLKDNIPMKKAPFYSLSELHMIPGIDDGLYQVFAPALTVSHTAGININSMKEATLRAIVPQMTTDEVTEFFKFRDSTEEDNNFKSADDFFKYLGNSVAAFQRDKNALQAVKDGLSKKNIQLITEETEFKITVQAQVNQSIRKIEAWVTLEPSSSGSSSSSNSSGNNNKPQQGNQPNTNSSPSPSASDAGIRITFMRIL